MGEEEDDEGVCVLKEACRAGLTQHYQALAILASQSRLHPEDSSKEPFVGMGVVYISPYIVGVSFLTAFLALSDWAKNKKSITDPRLLFVHLDPDSELMPLSVGYPVYLDLAKEEFKDKGEPKYWAASKLRAFSLQTASLPMTEGGARQNIVMWPCPKAPTPDAAQSRCCMPIEERLEAAGEVLYRGTMMVVTVVEPLVIHWTHTGD